MCVETRPWRVKSRSRRPFQEAISAAQARKNGGSHKVAAVENTESGEGVHLEVRVNKSR